ncbi:mucin-5B-like [Acanthaster planci]|uniref:Max-binding protein MNT n=1 Tax=Acanthaster planci TaxID=133434 RepID=A0A8B7ZVT3_ACAPL|nr:mucin-5B-like [Acanthaster planci]
MSIETLLEAAKFVEWSDQIGHSARGQNDPEVLGHSHNGQSMAFSGPSYVAVSSSPSSSPGSNKSSPVTSSRQQNVSSSNTDTLDEGDDKRSGTREVHNKLEKNRRAQLKECFDNLRDQIPNLDNKKLKPSNLSILQGALRYLQALKRKERELEYETERLARQKILYQEKLAKLSGCSLPPWKKAEPEPKEEEAENEMQDDKEDDRESVSTSTSTASEAEEEERKSRAQSPESKSSPVVQGSEKSNPSAVRTGPLKDRVIKVTQSVKEQSGPFVISRQIVTRVPMSTSATASQQQQQVAAQMPHQLQGANHKKATSQLQTAQGPAGQTQSMVVGTNPQLTITKESVPQRPPETMTQRVAATQKVVIRPPSAAQLIKTQQTLTQKPSSATQSTILKQPTSGPMQPSSLPQVIRQFDSHSTAVSAVQEHLKNKAQSKIPQQQKNPVRTISTTTMTTESTASSKANIPVVSTAAVVTSSTGVSRQTVSQLLGKQSMVIRQPVRRTDNKLIVQRVLPHPFSPRPQTVDIMPKSPTALSSSDSVKSKTNQATPTSITVVTYKDLPPSITTSIMSGSVPTTSSNIATNVSKQSVLTCTVQQATPSADARNLISHSVMLSSVPHYPPTAGFAATMLRPNPSMLTAANATLLNQAMVAGPRNVTSQLTFPGSKDSSPGKLQSPASGAVSFFPTAVTQARVSTVSHLKVPSLSYTTPMTPVHSFLPPGLTLQPALTQVLFTQPPNAAYTLANSTPAQTLVNTTQSHQTVIRHPLAATAGAQLPQVVTTMATAIVSSTCNAQTSVAMTLPPVVTIGALSLNPLLGTNRALVTAPTYTTLGQYPHRFPFAGQVPLISPVAFASNPSNAALPVTSVGSPASNNGKASNGVIVHTVAVPAGMPVTSSWLDTSNVSNGIPVKDLMLTAPATSGSSVIMGTTQPAVTTVPISSQEGSVDDSKIGSEPSVVVTSSN